MSQAGSFESGGIEPGSVTLNGDVSFATGATISVIAGVLTQNSGSSVEFVGNGATVLELNVTDGNENTIIGFHSGNATLTGHTNTSLGQNNFPSLTSGNDNTALGVNALSSVTSGNESTAIGVSALSNSQADIGNTAIGFNSLLTLNGGHQNTSVGLSAGGNLATGSFNLYLGNSAGSNNNSNESSNIYLNTLGVAAESNCLRVGRGTGISFEQLTTAFISGINGNILGGTPLMVTIDSSTDQLGVASIATGAIDVIDGDSGSITGATITIYADQAVRQAGSTVGFKNSGTTSLLTVTDASQNTFIGNLAGKAGLSGTANTGLGYQSLTAITTGYSNTGLGDATLASLTTGFENVAIGLGCLTTCVGGADNVGVGKGCLGVSTGSDNTSVGANSLGSTSTGNHLTALGFQAGIQLLTGTYDLYLGVNAGFSNVGAESSNIYLNSSGAPTESHCLRIGSATGTGTQQLSTAFISGINGVTLGGTPMMVTIDTLTDQLGVAAIPGGGGGITTINGDTGSITGATVTIYADNAIVNCGASVLFSNSGTTSLLQVTDINQNTLVGIGTGSLTSTGISNTAFGATAFAATSTANSTVAIGLGALTGLTAGDFNVALGYLAGELLLTGSDNLYLGSSAGIGNVGAESSNIYLNSQGAGAESHVLRIGSATGVGDQQLTTAYIYGINGNTVANTMMVTIDSSTSQLGTAAVPISGLTWSDQALAFTAAVENGYFITAPLVVTLPAAPSNGDQIDVFVEVAGVGSVVVLANTGQTIRIGANVSTAGGNAADNSIGDCLQLVYRSTNTEWCAIGSQGSWVLA